MNRFLVSLGSIENAAILGYDEQTERLMLVDIQGDFSEKQHDWFFNWLPYNMDQLHQRSKHEKVQVFPVPENLSFERFWDEYDHKVGKKVRAHKLWDALSDSDRLNCFKAIPRYKFWLAHKNIEKLYPETFLSQRRWENEFKV